MLTTSKRFEDIPHKFGSTKAYHGDGGFLGTEGEWDEGWVLLMWPLYVWTLDDICAHQPDPS